ncbi:MAG: dephospho-CoA kinase [Caldilineae bacterium]|nr:dephospho-CoA kinase [Chloroflexota bacterium]MCB9176790.1 dephospho-CoA kinase [Caldilineae bacterium]
MGSERRIGLTGDVGSGKSSVRRWLEARGAGSLDLDRVARALLEQAPQRERVRQAFGDGVLDADGHIDRAALARRVFAEPRLLQLLEAIVHPMVEREVEAWLAAQASQLAVIEGIKLVETGMHPRFTALWLVTCAPDERRRRLLERGWDEAEVARRMAAATAFAPRLAAATAVIDNSGAWSATERQLERALARFLQRPPSLPEAEWTARRPDSAPTMLS